MVSRTIWIFCYATCLWNGSAPVVYAHVSSVHRTTTSSHVDNNSGMSATTLTNNNDSTNGLLQVFETEVWDDPTKSWRAKENVEGEHPTMRRRWTDEHGYESASPLELNAPEGFDFVGDWKIRVQTMAGEKDGWEYLYSPKQVPVRRRLWLRMLEQKQQYVHHESPSRTTIPSAIVSTGPSRRQARAILPKQVASATKAAKMRTTASLLSKALRNVQDEFNFKGLGISIYKSFMSPLGCGLALRLPISTHFDSWDTRPDLPTLNTSINIYYPLTCAVFLSSSIRMEWVKHVATQAVWTAQHIFHATLHTLVMTILRVLSPWLTQQQFQHAMEKLSWLYQWSLIETNPFSQHPNYNSDIQERLGMSFSYRWSPSKGFHWRLSCWHMYLPTLRVYRRLLGSLVSMSNTMSTSSTLTKWMESHSGSIGLDTACWGLLPSVEPGYSITGLLSLSGLYLNKNDVDAVTHQEALTTSHSETSMPSPKLDRSVSTIDQQVDTQILQRRTLPILMATPYNDQIEARLAISPYVLTSLSRQLHQHHPHQGTQGHIHSLLSLDVSSDWSKVNPSSENLRSRRSKRKVPLATARGGDLNSSYQPEEELISQRPESEEQARTLILQTIPAQQQLLRPRATSASVTWVPKP